jgi:multisubunit Na+/H+ antiporter MnhB subunit
MLALHVAIRPGVASSALLVVTSATWVCLLVEGLEMLLAIWIYWWLPLLVWIVRVVRHLSGGMALAQQKLV